MNSKTGVGIIVLVLAGLIVTGAFWIKDSDKVAFIDSKRVLEASTRMQELKTSVEKEQAIVRANIDTLSMEFENALKEYERKQLKMTSGERELSQELLRNKQQQLVQYQQAVQQKMQGEEYRKTQEVLSEINTKIRQYGERNGYRLILATADGNIAYGDKSAEITEEIVKEIND